MVDSTWMSDYLRKPFEPARDERGRIVVRCPRWLFWKQLGVNEPAPPNEIATARFHDDGEIDDSLRLVAHLDALRWRLRAVVAYQRFFRDSPATVGEGLHHPPLGAIGLIRGHVERLRGPLVEREGVETAARFLAQVERVLAAIRGKILYGEGLDREISGSVRGWAGLEAEVGACVHQAGRMMGAHWPPGEPGPDAPTAKQGRDETITRPWSGLAITMQRAAEVIGYMGHAGISGEALRKAINKARVGEPLFLLRAAGPARTTRGMLREDAVHHVAKQLGPSGAADR